MFLFPRATWAFLSHSPNLHTRGLTSVSALHVAIGLILATHVMWLSTYLLRLALTRRAGGRRDGVVLHTTCRDSKVSWREGAAAGRWWGGRRHRHFYPMWVKFFGQWHAYKYGNSAVAFHEVETLQCHYKIWAIYSHASKLSLQIMWWLSNIFSHNNTSRWGMVLKGYISNSLRS